MTYLKFKTIRNTSQKWIEHRETSCSISQMNETHLDDVDVTTSTFPSDDTKNHILERVKLVATFRVARRWKNRVASRVSGRHVVRG